MAAVAVAKDPNTWYIPDTDQKLREPNRPRHDDACEAMGGNLREQGRLCETELSLKRQSSPYRTGMTAQQDNSATDLGVRFRKGKKIWIFDVKLGRKKITEHRNQLGGTGGYSTPTPYTLHPQP